MIVKLLLAVIFFLPSFFIDAAVKGSFLTSLPVSLTSHVEMVTEESLPILHLSSKSSQQLKFEFLLPNEEQRPQENRASMMPSIPMIFTLKELLIDLCVNEECDKFDAKKPSKTLPLLQLGQILDKPLYFRKILKGQLIDSAKEIEKVLTEFPAIECLNLAMLLDNLLMPSFLLLDKTVAVGDLFEESCFCDSTGLLPDKLAFQITRIDENNIYASITGKLNSGEIVLNTPLKMSDGQESKIVMKTSGDITGEIFWDRRNVLVYTLKTLYISEAILTAGDLKWNLNVRVIQEIHPNKN